MPQTIPNLFDEPPDSSSKVPDLFDSAPDLFETPTPVINPMEVDRRLQADAKTQKAQADAAAIQAQQAQENDPNNWSLEQTKKHFKDNPPANMQESVAANLLIKSKEKVLKDTTDQLFGNAPEPDHPVNMFSQIGQKIEKTLGDMGVIESPEFKAIKKAHADAMAQKYGLNPDEVYKNYESYLFNPEISGVKTNFLERISLPMPGGGPIRNTEAVINRLITPAVVAGLVTAPAQTLAGLAVFTGVNSFDEWAGVGKQLEQSGMTPESKSFFRIVRMIAEGGVTGKVTGAALTPLFDKVPALRSTADFFNNLLGKPGKAPKAPEVVSQEKTQPSENPQSKQAIPETTPQVPELFPPEEGAATMQFVSPNEKINMKIDDAVSAIKSPAQDTFKQFAQHVDESLGTKSETQNAIGAWTDGAENTVITKFHSNVSPEVLDYSTALKGLAGNQKQALRFSLDNNGSDTLHYLQVQDKNAKGIYDTLQKNGIQYFTISDEPGPTSGVYILNIGSDGNVLNAVSQARQQYGQQITKYQAAFGQGKFLGDPNGASRDVARRNYLQEIRAYEGRVQSQNEGIGNRRYNPRPEHTQSLPALKYLSDNPSADVNVKPLTDTELAFFKDKVTEELKKNNKGRELSPAEQQAQEFVLADTEQARQNYIDRSLKEFGSDNVVSADIGKFAIPDMSGEKSAAYHEAGSALTKARTEELLNNPATKDLPVAFMAGGSGSGKSNILREAVASQGGTLQSKYSVVYDTNLNHYDSSHSKIQQALDLGKDVQVTYVYRDPIKAWSEGVLPRVRKQNRIVPIIEHIKTHRDSLPTVEKLMQDFKDDPRVSFHFINNDFAKGEWKQTTIDKLPRGNYTHIGAIEDKLYDLTKEAFDAGKITQGEFEAALSGDPKLQTRAAKEGLTGGAGGAGAQTPPGEKSTASGLGPQPPGPLATKSESLYQKYVNRFQSIENTVQRAKEAGATVLPGEDPALLARSYLGVGPKVQTVLDRSTFTVSPEGRIQITGEGLKPILDDYLVNSPDKNPDNAQQYLKDYLISTRTIEDLQRPKSEFSDKQIVTEEQVKKAEATLESLRTRFNGDLSFLQDTASRLYSFQSRVLHNLVDSGLLSQERYDKILELNPHYIPFDRVMDTVDNPSAVPISKRRFTDVRSPVKRIKGSEKEIHDPIESVIKNTYKIMDVSGRNMVAKSVAKLGDTLPEEITPVRVRMFPIKISESESLAILEKELQKRGFDSIESLAESAGPERAAVQIGDIIKEMKLEDKIKLQDLGESLSAPPVIFRPSQFKPKGNIIEYFDGGKRKFMEVSDNMYQAMSGLNEAGLGLMTKILSMPAHWLRVGATITPEFMLRNPIRDQFTAAMQTSFGFKPFVDTTGAMADILNKRDAYYDWMRSGGAYSAFTELSRTRLKAAVEELIKPGSQQLLKRLNIITNAQDISQFFEQATRLAVFKAAKKSGMSDIEAGFQSRESTLDFARRGSQTKDVNAVIAFFNANVQAFDKFFRTAAEDPAGFAAKGIGLITIPSVVLAMVNHNDPDFKEIPQWQRDMFWITKINGVYVRIPKPFSYGQIFGSIPERFLSYVLDKDPKAFNNMAQSIYDSFSPVSGEPTSGLLPTGLRPLIENETNWNFFLQRNIVPDSRKDLIPSEQYAKYTTETAKLAGKALNYSPAKIENLVYGYLGGTGRYAMEAGDALINGIREAKGEPIPQKRPKELSDYPLLKGFVARPVNASPESVQDFYTNYQQVKAVAASYKKLLKENRVDEAKILIKDHPEYKYAGSMEEFYQAIHNYTQIIDRAIASKTYTEDQKRKIIDNYEKKRTEMAQKANKFLESRK